MSLELSTQGWTASECQERWTETIIDTYFSLSLDFAAEQPFDGYLQRWSTPTSDLSLSHLLTSPIDYSRNQAQIGQDHDAFYLVTLPCRADIHFQQSGNDILCNPGHFILERGDSPFHFRQHNENELWVLKLPESALKGHLRGPERYTRYSFDATRGLGRIFFEQVSACARHFDDCPESSRHVLLEQILATLLLTLQQDDRVLSSEGSSLSALHLSRVERYVQQNLGDPDLSPQTIANACSLSLRYLHKLFSSTPHTLSEWIRQQRLEMVYRQLRNPQCHLSIGELAFRSGFSDQAQFTRAFRQRFGSTAREVRTSLAH